MKTTWTNVTMAICTACFVGSALAMEISDVVARQRWPWSRLVDIDYVLTCDATQRVDIVIAAKDGSETLTLPAESLLGDLYGVSHGPRRIIWDPTKTDCTNSHMLTQFRVTLAPTPVPLYMIVDLTKTAGADGQIEYVYEADLRTGVWGSWTENPVTNAGTPVSSVVWTGVTTNAIYKTDKLVLRRIPAGAFAMGSPSTESVSGRDASKENLHTVTLTKDFYLGVFEVTQKQWERIMSGANPSWFNNSTYYAARPVERVAYHSMRGASNDTSSVNWPGTGTYVSPASFIGRLRNSTGVWDLDLPTEAQWEYAGRAGTTGAINDGTANLTNTTADLRLDDLCRYKLNGGQFWDGGSWVNPAANSTAEAGTAPVGSFQPNAWGLFDMHGNVLEFCLDWYVAGLGTSAVRDPQGSDTGTQRVIRGGGIADAAAGQRSAARNSRAPTDAYYAYLGFRVALPLR